MIARFSKLTLAAAIAAALPAAAIAQQATLKVVSFVPKTVGYSLTFQKLFVDKVNGDAQAPIKIDFAGGPEVTPPAELGRALKGGVIDMQLGPPGLWLNLVPEGDAVFGSNLTPAERRANGGMDLLNQVFAKKLNGTILAHAAGGFGFHIFLIKEPKLAADGNLDLKGLKIRVAPAWRDFVTQLGATGIVLELLDRDEIDHARRNPPAGTPAAVRGRFIREFADDDDSEIAANWHAVYLGHGRDRPLPSTQQNSAQGSSATDHETPAANQGAFTLRPRTSRGMAISIVWVVVHALLQ